MNLLEPLTRLLPATLRSLLPGGRAWMPTRGLASILGVASNDLDTIRLGPRYHYRPFTLAKPDGRERRILARVVDEYLGAIGGRGRGGRCRYLLIHRPSPLRAVDNHDLRLQHS